MSLNCALIVITQQRQAGDVPSEHVGNPGDEIVTGTAQYLKNDRPELLEPLFIDGLPLHEILTQAASCPDAKLRRDLALHPVADGDNSIQVVGQDLSADRPIALDLNL